MLSVVCAEAGSWQRLSKHVPAATDNNAKTEEQCFLYGSCRDVITMTVGAMSSVRSLC
jgi:hypothetical protein